MASKPVQRSLKHLRDNGWTVCIVEKYIKHPNMAFGKRIDAFGIGDLLACTGYQYGETCTPCKGKGYEDNHFQGKLHCPHCNGTGKRRVRNRMIALVQCCSTDFAKHKEKILEIPEFQVWKAAGGEVILHGWAKRGARGKRKTYQLREEFL